MMIFAFLGPLVASVLYVIVFQKAGFWGPILFVCAAPLLGALLGRALIGAFYMGGGMAFAFLIPTALPLALVAVGVAISLVVGTSVGFAVVFPIPLLMWSGLICKLGFSGWPKAEDTATGGGRS